MQEVSDRPQFGGVISRIFVLSLRLAGGKHGDVFFAIVPPARSES
jgi:hypothetical protein